MIFGEPDLEILRLTNQLMAVAIMACILVIGVFHAADRHVTVSCKFTNILMILFGIRLLMASFGDVGFNVLPNIWRQVSNGISFAILLLLLSYIVFQVRTNFSKM